MHHLLRIAARKQRLKPSRSAIFRSSRLSSYPSTLLASTDDHREGSSTSTPDLETARKKEITRGSGWTGCTAGRHLRPSERSNQTQHHPQPPNASRRRRPAQLHRHNAKPGHNPKSRPNYPTSTLYKPASSTPSPLVGQAIGEEKGRSLETKGDSQQEVLGERRKRGK